MVVMVVPTFSSDWSYLLQKTYLTEGSMFSWWQTTLGSMLAIYLGGTTNILELAFIHLTSSSLIYPGSLTPIFIILVGFFSSWRTVKSSSETGLRIFILASIGRGISDSCFYLDMDSSRHALNYAMFMSKACCMEKMGYYTFSMYWMEVVSKFLYRALWMWRAFVRYVQIVIDSSWTFWYFIFIWTMEETTSRVVAEGLSKM